jgi:hypothetical protein
VDDVKHLRQFGSVAFPFSHVSRRDQMSLRYAFPYIGVHNTGDGRTTHELHLRKAKASERFSSLGRTTLSTPR